MPDYGTEEGKLSLGHHGALLFQAAGSPDLNAVANSCGPPSGRRLKAARLSFVIVSSPCLSCLNIEASRPIKWFHEVHIISSTTDNLNLTALLHLFSAPTWSYSSLKSLD